MPGVTTVFWWQLAGESFVSASKFSTPGQEVDKSLASIRPHRPEKNADQDDVPFGVEDWSPSPLDVATDGIYASKQNRTQPTTSTTFQNNCTFFVLTCTAQGSLTAIWITTNLPTEKFSPTSNRPRSHARFRVFTSGWHESIIACLSWQFLGVLQEHCVCEADNPFLFLLYLKF